MHKCIESTARISDLFNSICLRLPFEECQKTFDCHKAKSVREPNKLWNYNYIEKLFLFRQRSQSRNVSSLKIIVSSSKTRSCSCKHSRSVKTQELNSFSRELHWDLQFPFDLESFKGEKSKYVADDITVNFYGFRNCSHSIFGNVEPSVMTLPFEMFRFHEENVAVAMMIIAGMT